LTTERLRSLVVDEQRGVKSIARDYDVDRKTVAAALVRENIPMGPPGGRTRFAIDGDWLRREYVDKRRPLPDIAREFGTTPTNISRIAKKHGIPLRARGGPSHARNVALPSAALPLPLAVAIAGEGGPERVRRFQILARCPSIRQAAGPIGCNEPTLYAQLCRLERACGGDLVVRYTRSHERQQLTPLGRHLLEQADSHLGHPASAPPQDLPHPLSAAVSCLQGPERVRRFVTIAAAASLREAARFLGAHETTLSNQVKMLEAACGGQLLRRRTGPRAPQRVTALGRLLVEQAEMHRDLGDWV